jgi:hypothetical protein
MGFEMLELYEAKVSGTVLRGERRSNPPDLPDVRQEVMKRIAYTLSLLFG